MSNLVGERLRKLRKQLGSISQEKLGGLMDCDKATIYRWERGDKGDGEPTLSDLEILWNNCKKYNYDVKITYILDLLGIILTKSEKSDFCGPSREENSHEGVRWIEEKFPEGYLSKEQEKQVVHGIRVFRELFVLNKHRRELEEIEEWKVELPHLKDKYAAFKTAIQTGALRITHVERELDLERRIKQIAKTLAPSIQSEIDVIVANVPNCDGTPIRAEFVSFLAAKRIFADQRVQSPIAFGAGYTMWRIAQHSSLVLGEITGTYTWIPLIAFRNERKNPYTANHIARLMASLHRGSEALIFPHHDLDDSEKTWSEIRENLPNAKCIILTVNGTGRRFREDEEYGIAALYDDDFINYFPEIINIWEAARHPDKREHFAEVLGFFLDEDGNVLDNKKIRTITKDNISQFEGCLDLFKTKTLDDKIWIVASMEYKARAILRAMKAGIANGYVIDSTIANFIINETEKTENKSPDTK
jgi:transcriptional regulator with XRE-family HTH domain